MLRRPASGDVDTTTKVVHKTKTALGVRIILLGGLAEADPNYSLIRGLAASLAGHGFDVDYVTVANADSLVPAGPGDRSLVVAAAASWRRAFSALCSALRRSS